MTLKEIDRSGLRSNMCLSCEVCESANEFSSSRMVADKNRVGDINRRSIVTIRSVGLGLSSLRKCCAHLELPPPVQKHSYQLILRKLHSAVTEEAEKSMMRASEEEAHFSGSRDVGVSGDGSWQKKSHYSLNGVCSVIGLKSGKIIDVEVLSKVSVKLYTLLIIVIMTLHIF